MDTPEGSTYDNPEDDLWFQIRWHLFNQLAKQQMRIEELGEQNIMPDADKFLKDFSSAWRGVPDPDIPQWLRDETRAYQEQQKAQETTVTLGDGSVNVFYTDTSDRIRISTARGDAEFPRSLCAELGRLLQSLQRVALPSEAGTTSAPRQYETRPNNPGWKSQAQLNDEALERSIKIQREKQNAIIRQQQLEYQQRNRW